MPSAFGRAIVRAALILERTTLTLRTQAELVLGMCKHQLCNQMLQKETQNPLETRKDKLLVAALSHMSRTVSKGHVDRGVGVGGWSGLAFRSLVWLVWLVFFTSAVREERTSHYHKLSGLERSKSPGPLWPVLLECPHRSPGPSSRAQCHQPSC